MGGAVAPTDDLGTGFDHRRGLAVEAEGGLEVCTAALKTAHHGGGIEAAGGGAAGDGAEHRARTCRCGSGEGGGTAADQQGAAVAVEIAEVGQADVGGQRIGAGVTAAAGEGTGDGIAVDLTATGADRKIAAVEEGLFVNEAFVVLGIASANTAGGGAGGGGLGPRDGARRGAGIRVGD